MWTIKAMPIAERQAAAQAAQRQDRSQGEWLAMAIRTQLQLESGALAPTNGAVLPPDIPVRPAVTPLDLAGLEALARICATVAGAPVPRSVSRLMWRHVRERLTGGLTKSLTGETMVIPSIEVAPPRPPDRRDAD
jgi:hypothetical protein